MNIEIQRPEIIRFAYYQESTDKNFGSCLWAFFDCDIKDNALAIRSDCGNYAYSYWSVKGDFIKFLAGLSRDYIANKLLGNPKRVSFAGTRENIRMALEDNDDYEADELEEMLDQLMEEIEQYDPDHSHGLIYKGVEDWLDNYDIALTAEDMIELDWTPQQKRIIEIFVTCIQPEMRRYLRGERTVE